MPERTLVGRVEILEHKVEGLEALPGRVHAVELQIVQLRSSPTTTSCTSPTTGSGTS